MTEQTPFKIFIGWDSREDIAYQVAKKSIEDHASIPVEIIPLKQHELRKMGVYTRPKDKLASTEFTFTRYLVPYLADYEGWALFIDCDFLFLDDVAKLVEQIDDSYAIMCAQHQYTPKPGKKMDGQIQTQYPRKNWSSMMLINCEHPKNKQELVLDKINDESFTGAHFHRFAWLPDSSIGEVSHEWNWLVGWYEEPTDGKPKVLHYTEGGPWFDNYKDCEYAAEWNAVAIDLYKDEVQKKTNELIEFKKRDVDINDLDYNDQKKELIKDFLHHTIDPVNHFYKEKDKFMGNKVAAINTSEASLKKGGFMFDPILENFVQGSNGYISTWDKELDKDSTLVIRGVGGGSQKAYRYCWENNRDFYAIDTGYFGNVTKKIWHRATLNHLQNSGPIIERPFDRLSKIDWKYRRQRRGSKILICPPSEKVMNLFDQPSPDEWTKSVVEQLGQLTDREIVIRLKPNRTDRITTNTIWQALEDDVYCLITYNSIAALESLMNGVPAIALGPNAASALCNTNLSEIEQVNYPTKDEMMALMAHLSYSQFTVQEFRNGKAWQILNEDH